MPGAPRPAARSTLCPVMVGRDQELEALERSWRSAGQLVVVHGAAGIGKSRLVRELATRVTGSGGVVLTGRCSPAAGDVPLRPLREALLAGDRRGLRPSEALQAFLPALGTVVPAWAGTDDPGADRGAVMLAEGLLRLIAAWATAAERATVLVIEDLHWSDPETLEVVEYLAHNLAGQPAMVVATVRDGEGGPGSDLVSALEARRAAVSIQAGPLDQSQTVAMLRACLGVQDVPDDVLDAVVARSDGIPFFVEELLASALGSPSAPGSPSGRGVPVSIGAALEGRLASLAESTAQLVRYAAVLGRQFDWRVVADALRYPPEDAAGALRQAIGAQLVDHVGETYRFRHALTVEAVQDSLLSEERQAIGAGLLRSLEALHPGLEGERCQLAASLAEGAGDVGRAADLWLDAARRALAEGSLTSAEALALRARPRRPIEADRLLLSTWAMAGQPLRALEVGERILRSGADPSVQTEVRFDLVDALIDAGRWDDARRHLACLRGGSSPSHVTRRAIGESEVALAGNDREAAMAFARAALADAQAAGLPDLTCRALWLIGRVERGRDTAQASRAFEEAYAYATRHGLAVSRARSLLELGTIDMFETLATGRLEEARRAASVAGALSTAAMIDLHLAGTYSARGETAATLEAAVRCEEASRRFGLSSLPMSLALQGVAHGISGDRAAMERAVAAMHEAEGDHDTARMIVLANGVALDHLGNGRLLEAVSAMDAAMELLGTVVGGPYDFPGRWALMRTVANAGGEAARERCRSLELDTAMSRATLQAADAVALGREGGDATPLFSGAYESLARFDGGFLRSLAGLLVAPCAHRDGWGEPAAWLREALATFDGLGLATFAGQSRLALRAMGEAAPRRPRSDRAGVPRPLAAQGVTAREAEVMAHVVAGRSNRDIAARLHLSVRTVEKHVERLLVKTGASRTELGALAEATGLRPAE